MNAKEIHFQLVNCLPDLRPNTKTTQILNVLIDKVTFTLKILLKS